MAGRPVTYPFHNPPAKETEGSSRGRRYSGLLMAAALAVAQPRGARAENSLSYEYEDYREMGGRISVDTSSALLEQDLGTDMHAKLGGIIDTIAGATPSGMPAPAGSDQVVLTHETDQRHAWNADLSRQLSAINVDVGFARSLEHDYVSNGWSVNTLSDFNQKNTTLLVGAAGTDDNVQVFFEPAWLRKISNQAIVGVTQLIDPQTSVSVNATWTRATGYLSEQYKVVEVDVQIFPGIFLPETFGENRPNARNKGDVFASVNRAFPAVAVPWRRVIASTTTPGASPPIRWSSLGAEGGCARHLPPGSAPLPAKRRAVLHLQPRGLRPPLHARS